MDDFNWGSTRIVVGEKGGKKIVATADDEKFHDKIIPMKRWEEHAQEKSLPVGPAMEVVDTSASVFAEEYPVPASISRWQQGVRGSNMPASSQVGVGMRQSAYVGSQYAPSMVSMPRSMGPRGDFLEMAEFANGGRTSMVNPQIHVMRLPPGSIAMSQTQSRYGSEVGFRLPVQSPPLMGNEFDGFDSGSRLTDEMLAREVVRNVLKEVDINTTTTKQVRALVETKLGLGSSGSVSAEQRKALDEMIDKELEEMI